MKFFDFIINKLKSLTECDETDKSEIRVQIIPEIYID